MQRYNRIRLTVSGAAVGIILRMNAKHRVILLGSSYCPDLQNRGVVNVPEQYIL